MAIQTVFFKKWRCQFRARFRSGIGLGNQGCGKKCSRGKKSDQAHFSGGGCGGRGESGFDLPHRQHWLGSEAQRDVVNKLVSEFQRDLPTVGLTPCREMDQGEIGVFGEECLGADAAPCRVLAPAKQEFRAAGQSLAEAGRPVRPDLGGVSRKQTDFAQKMDFWRCLGPFIQKVG